MIPFRCITIVAVLIFTSSFGSPPKKNYTINTVVIDAGHGGHDSGCLGSKYKEKDIALALALKLGGYISKNFPQVKVIYTRKTDVFIGLMERAEIANRNHADLFICIHCNSACTRDKKTHKDICNEETHGVETWVMGLHKTEANLEVSKRENDVVLFEKDYKTKYDGFDPDSPEGNIIFTLYQNAFLDQSLKMASLVQREMASSANREVRGVKQAGFLVLYKTAMPSLLIETGFLTNKSEEKYLTSEEGQDQMANSIYRAFCSYKASLEAAVPMPEVSTPGDSSKQINKNDSAVSKPHQTVADTSGVSDKKISSSTPSSKKNLIFYSVQFYSTPKALLKSDVRLKKVKDYFIEKSDGKYRYYTGKEKSLNDATTLQAKLKSKGFKDAFVIAFNNGKRISIKEAEQLLKKN